MQLPFHDVPHLRLYPIIVRLYLLFHHILAIFICEVRQNRLCGSGFVQPHCGEGRRGGKRHPCEGDGQGLPRRDEHERHHRRRCILHIQCQVCKRAATTQCGNGGLHPRWGERKPSEQRHGGLSQGTRKRKPDAGKAHHEIHSQGGQAGGEAHRQQVLRYSVPAQRVVFAQRTAVLPYGTTQQVQRAVRHRLHHVQNRGQEGRQTDGHAGAGAASAACLQLHHLRGGAEERTHGIHPAKVHHPR